MPFINRTRANSVLFLLIWNVLKFSTFVCLKSMYVLAHKLSGVHLIVKKVKNPPQNPKGTKQSSFQRGLYSETLLVLLIVEQNPLHNFCGCLKLTKQLGDKNLLVAISPDFLSSPSEECVFRAYTTQSKEGGFFWMKHVLS